MSIHCLKLTTLFLFLTNLICIGQTFTFSGTVQDSSTLETLPHAFLQLDQGHFSNQTNTHGQFSMRVPKGTYDVIVSYIGYRAKILKITVNESKNLKILLSSAVTELKEIQIHEGGIVQDNVPGRNRLSIDQILKQPAFAGEADVLKSLQFLPGVKSPSEATTNLSVRGGSYDQTLILLDGAPVYNSAHALGFFSTFNADAIKDVELYKGMLPPRYGNRLSSVVDIRMRDGDVNKYRAKIGIGLIATRATVEGPLKKGESSFIVSGRYSYAGSVVNTLGNIAQNFNAFGANNFRKGNTVKFYDLNAKVSFKDKSGRNRFFLSAYSGRDRFNYFVLQGSTFMDWGNQTASFQWNSSINNRLSMTSIATYSSYGYHYQVLNDSRRFDWNAGQKELNLKTEFQYAISPSYSISFGGQSTINSNQPGKIAPLDSIAVITPYQLPKKHSVINSIFLENWVNIGKSIKISAGFRQSLFSLIGPGVDYHHFVKQETTSSDSTIYGKFKTIKSYMAFEPRIGITWLLSSKQSLKLSINKTTQFSHLLTNSSVGLPTDIWFPSNRLIKPQSAKQASLGYYQTAENNSFNFTIEGYYKTMQNVIDFVDNADLFVNKNVETQIRAGKGLAYGIESMLVKQAGKFRYQVSYTWSKTTRTIKGINNNNAYYTRDDRRHALSVTSLYQIPKKRIEFSANFLINSGAPITMPANTFYYQGALFYDYSGRNQFRMPIYHRLDISFIFHKLPKPYGESSWIFSIHNLYNRKNVFTAVSQTQDYASFQLYQITGLSAFGIVPSITYNLVLK